VVIVREEARLHAAPPWRLPARCSATTRSDTRSTR